MDRTTVNIIHHVENAHLHELKRKNTTMKKRLEGTNMTFMIYEELRVCWKAVGVVIYYIDNGSENSQDVIAPELNHPFRQ